MRNNMPVTLPRAIGNAMERCYHRPLRGAATRRCLRQEATLLQTVRENGYSTRRRNRGARVVTLSVYDMRRVQRCCRYARKITRAAR